MSLVEWCLLLLCIAGVLTAEMFNSALESMAKAITGESDPHLGNSLDIGSAAVLVASIGAVDRRHDHLRPPAGRAAGVVVKQNYER